MGAKLRVVWVDHDSAIEEMLDTLRKVPTSWEGRRARIEDFAELHTCIVSEKLVAEELAAVVHSDIVGRFGTSVDLVLVDMFFGTENSPDGYNAGLDRAGALMRLDPFTPVGVYTRNHFHQPKQYAKLSAEGFAVILSPVDTLILSQRTRETALLPTEWLEIFQNARARKVAMGNAIPAFFRCSLPCDVEWEGEDEFSTTKQFRRAAEVLAGKLTVRFDRKKVYLEKISGGFSGSGLVKVRTDAGPATFVLKVDERVERIESEIRGYRVMEASVSRKCYLNVIGPEKVLDDLWCGILMQYEDEMIPLLFCERLTADDLGRVFGEVWDSCLFGLYGTEFSRKVVPMEGRLQTLEAALGRKRTQMERYLALWERLPREGDCFSASFEAVKGMTSGRALRERSLTTLWCDRVHGDLNCRNVLVNDGTFSVLLIDFPAVRDGPLCEDFVKAECEYVVVVLGYADGSDVDVASIDGWLDLVRDTTGCFVDEGWRGERGVVGSIRRKFLEAAGTDQCHQTAYLIHLALRVVKYLGYPDIPHAKKILVVLWIFLILKEAERVLCGGDFEAHDRD